MFRLLKVPFFLLVLLIAVGAARAFASSAEAPRQAGAGSAPVGGYTVTSISYRLSPDSSLVQAISLELDKSAGTVAIRVVSASSDYLPCTWVSGTRWDCPLTQVDIADIDQIQVIALGE